MYYQNYENYMRAILGQPIQMSQNDGYNTYPNYSNSNSQYEYLPEMPRYSDEILALYPDIYKLVNPMVCKICEANTKPISRELIEQMTDEIYLNLESDTGIEEEVINVRVNLPKSKSESSGNRIEPSKTKNTNTTANQKSARNDKLENNSRVEEKSKEISTSSNRQNRVRNNTLRDLIKILILNRLLGIGGRPPRPNPPHRPPFPGPGPGPRPPIMPRNTYNNLVDYKNY